MFFQKIPMGIETSHLLISNPFTTSLLFVGSLQMCEFLDTREPGECEDGDDLRTASKIYKMVSKWFIQGGPQPDISGVMTSLLRVK